ncbi:MAG: tRNA (N(6)-L-threonylcarbamoyladenosine(37)-C(2))-methylthiotransferase MtaB [Desulfomonilaceae bacterium]
MNRTALVQVLGCKVNQAEAASLARILQQNGYRIDDKTAEPDLVLIHTCCVTMKAEGKSRRTVNRLVEKYPSSKILVTGCLAEVSPSNLAKISDNIIVLSAVDSNSFYEVINADGKPISATATESPLGRNKFMDLGPSGIPGRSRTFLKIQDGCSQCCTYCIVPTARGPSRSLSAQLVVDHARNLGEKGFDEIVLTGVHLGHYGRDLQPRLCLEDLLERLLDQCPNSRFRLSSVEPNEISFRLIELASGNPRLCRHFHIPFQSGDDEVLNRMRRPYNTSMIRNLMERIQSRVPDVCVGFDIMVGFPGEDESAFINTKNLIKDLRPAYLHVFPFSPRPGTAAAVFEPRISEKTKRRRVEELRALSASLRQSFYNRFLGKNFSVVSESLSPRGLITARTDNYIPVRLHLPPSFHNKSEFEIIIEKIESDKVWGKVAEPRRVSCEDITPK